MRGTSHVPSGTPAPDSLPPGLYVVATPIGNLADLSARARGVLARADLIAAEDTRTAKALLAPGARRGRLLSLTEHNLESRAPRLLAGAAEGAVALVSEAGTPGIADPAVRLVARAHDAGVPVFAVPGPSALVAALSTAGFETNEVLFLGFLPRRAGPRIARLRSAAGAAATVVFFESPGRLARTLGELADHLGDPRVAVCRELTKIHEETRRGRASELQRHYAAGVRGECTVVFETPERKPDRDAAARWLRHMAAAGARRSAAAAAVAREFGLTRAQAQRLWPGAEEGHEERL